MVAKKKTETEPTPEPTEATTVENVTLQKSTCIVTVPAELVEEYEKDGFARVN